MVQEDDWGDLVGVSASVWTILQMLSPLLSVESIQSLTEQHTLSENIALPLYLGLTYGTFDRIQFSLPSCYHFVMKQSVGDMIVTPYVVAFTSCTLWLFYGFIIGDFIVVRVNVIGAGLQFIYTLCYYLYCLKKAQVRKQMVGGLCVILTAVTYAYFETNYKRLVKLLGFFCSCVTVAFFASPLANLSYVIKIWNSESLPRLLICATFIVSVQWTLYGYLISDNYILVTNLLGTILSTVQLCMLLIIPRESSPKLISTI